MRKLATAAGVGFSATLGRTLLVEMAVPTRVWIAVALAVVSLTAVARLRRSVFGADPRLTGR